MKQVSEQIKQSDERIAELDRTQRELLLTIPNIPHSSVPVGVSAADNLEVRRWGTPAVFDFQPKPHWEVGEQAEFWICRPPLKLPAPDLLFTRVGRAIGTGVGELLSRCAHPRTRLHGNTAAISSKHGVTRGAGQLPKFAADLFKIENTDFWLSPTSEVELHNLYRDETLPEEKLPISVTAWTACFRSEAGAAGKDTRGILRPASISKGGTLQIYASGNQLQEHEALVRNAETILQKLGLALPHGIACSGDMGFASAKTYDIEVWLPCSKEFREISSCSNCEAFQARRAGIRFKPKAGARATLCTR